MDEHPTLAAFITAVEDRIAITTGDTFEAFDMILRAKSGGVFDDYEDDETLRTDDEVKALSRRIHAQVIADRDFLRSFR